MTRTYYLKEPASSGLSHIDFSAFTSPARPSIGYTAYELHCLTEFGRLRWEPRSFGRWLRLRWFLLVSSQRVIQHVRRCTYRQYRIEQRRQERIARRAARRS